MEQRSLRVVETDKTFFSKLSSTISKILIPTRVGLNGVMISIKRNSLIKAYNNYLEKGTEENSKKYEDSYALYLEAIDKYIMDSLYKKVKSNTATNFERDAIAKYYFVVSLKNKNYLEYKYKKQEYLLRIDYETVSNMKNQKVVNNYKNFYVAKMDTLYKGLLKNYSVAISDDVHQDSEEAYKKIFDTLEKYIMEILPIKIEFGDDTAKEEYEEFLHTTVGKLDERDKIMQKVELLGVSRKIFIHSLPLAATEKCYNQILKQVRTLIVNSRNETKREQAYETLFEVMEDYNVKILSTKVYWDRPEERQAYKKFWEKYEKAKDGMYLMLIDACVEQDKMYEFVPQIIAIPYINDNNELQQSIDVEPKSISKNIESKEQESKKDERKRKNKGNTAEKQSKENEQTTTAKYDNKLPQTGQDRAIAVILATVGLVMIAGGVVVIKRNR